MEVKVTGSGTLRSAPVHHFVLHSLVWGVGGAGAGCGSAPALAAPKKAGWARGRWWAPWALGKGECRRGVPFRTRRGPRGRSPATTKALSGLGWAAPPPPFLPDTPICDARWVCGARSSLLLTYPHPSYPLCWDPCLRLGVPHWGEGDKQRGAGERDRRLLGFWPPGLRPAAVVGGETAAGWGRTRPSLPRREGGEGKGRRGRLPAVPGRGACSRPWAAPGRAGGPQRACALENFVPYPAGGRAGPGAGRAGSRSPGEVGRGAGRGGEDYSSRRAGAGRHRGWLRYRGWRDGGARPRGAVGLAGGASPPPLAGCWKGALVPDACVRLWDCRPP